MNASEWSHLAGETVRQQAAIRNAAKRARIVIGVEHDLRDLRREARNDMGEQRPPAKRQQRLVAAAHAARFAAGKHDLPMMPSGICMPGHYDLRQDAVTPDRGSAVEAYSAV